MRAPLALGLILVEYLLVSLGLDSSGTPWGHVAASAVAVAFAVALFAEQTRRAVFERRIESRSIGLHAIAFTAVAALVLTGVVTSTFVVALLATLAAVPLLTPLVPVLLAPRAIGAGLLGAIAFGAALSFDVFWPHLRSATLGAVATVLDVAGADVLAHVDEGIVGTTAFVVRIEPACSGMEGLGLMFVFVVGGLAWFRRDLVLSRAWVLVPVSAALMLVLNVLRISALIGVGHAGAPQLALGGFHSRAGWVGFCAVAAGLVEVARRSRWLRRDVPATFDAPAVAYLAPVAALLAGKLLVPLFSEDAELAYVIAAAASLLAVVAVRRNGLRALSPGPVGVPLLVGVVAFGAWRLFAPAQGTTDAWWLHFAVSVLLVPIAEELAFRGYLMRRLASARFEDSDPGRAPVWTVAVSSVVFGAAHEQFLAAVLAGLLFAWVYRRRGRLFDAVVAHAVANALVAFEVIV
ncbi:MAG: exosortase E/protease, VPEID-CTERM system [Deltaproteobacteria bacterium]